MIVLRPHPGHNAAASLDALKVIATLHPGSHRLRIDVAMDEGQMRHVTIGRTWSYDASAACLAALREFGDVEVVP